MEENQSLRKRLRKLQETAEEFEAQLADRVGLPPPSALFPV